MISTVFTVAGLVIAAIVIKLVLFSDKPNDGTGAGGKSSDSVRPNKE